MDITKVKRTYYLEEDTLRNLNNYVVSYRADGSTGSTYGAHSSVVNDAINFYTENFQSSADGATSWLDLTPREDKDDRE